MSKPTWEAVHRLFPELCEGSKKYKYNGCAAWNKELEVCMKIHMANGLCNRSIEDCRADMIKIRGGVT